MYAFSFIEVKIIYSKNFSYIIINSQYKYRVLKFANMECDSFAPYYFWDLFWLKH